MTKNEINKIINLNKVTKNEIKEKTSCNTNQAYNTRSVFLYHHGHATLLAIFVHFAHINDFVLKFLHGPDLACFRFALHQDSWFTDKGSTLSMKQIKDINDNHSYVFSLLLLLNLIDTGCLKTSH